MSNKKSTTTIACLKCNGTGHVRWASHYAKGRCFECHGAGSVRAGSVQAQSAQRQAYNLALQNVCKVIGFASENRHSDASVCIDLAVRELFRCGTANARKVLAKLRAGEGVACYPGGPVPRVSAAEAARLCAEVIARGRAQKETQG